MTPGILVAAPRSGSGKTVITLGLLRALARRGVRVQPYKCGPDYIDTGYHRLASGRAAFNLDSWAMDGAMIRGLAAQAVTADLALAEGAMGLFDGAAATGASGNGSSADIAAALGWPVILVIDVSGQSQSAAALAHGFRTLRPDLRVVGVILNRVASPRHDAMIRRAMEEIALPVLGAVPRSAALSLPERHLGLVQAGEQERADERIDAIADVVEAHVGLSALLACAGALPCAASCGTGWRPPGQRVALAQDAAFSFTYAHMLAGWQSAGAEILRFSPLADEAPDPHADAVWLPGGYPELHAPRLAEATRFIDGLRRHAQDRPVHGECGGYMVLGQAIIDAQGQTHAMAGLLGLVSSFAERRLHLGYRRARLLAPMGGYGEGADLRGHEFHYSTVVEQPDQPLAHVTDAAGDAVASTGSRRGLVTGSFFHLVAGAA
ncbi:MULTISPECIES: cobyrinate a,c-diamide synthase [Sphingobium]|uniref:cobyrinate a,c-diamide synthase n=1 Tax=Sphingobium sp. MI1205 TaxID=407020 RepID=UPI00077006CE|nr:cobyrinate a,c-diamide synthase [Sphingobium sp. MI1205]AMK20047.1 cobyrinic acid a,c-diamide synthase [Sphingobium sp. MI1205]